MAGHKFQVISVVLASAAVGIGLGVKDSLMRSTEIAPNSQVAKDVPVAPSLADNEDYLKEAVSCSDKRGSTSCNRWTWHCTNGGWQSWMKTNCEKTCGHCSEAGSSGATSKTTEFHLGGTSSSDYSERHGDIKRRPQWVHYKKCTGDTCTGCGAEEAGCFSTDKYGQLIVDGSTFTSGQTAAIADVFIDCPASSSGTLTLEDRLGACGSGLTVSTGTQDYGSLGGHETKTIAVSGPTWVQLKSTAGDMCGRTLMLEFSLPAGTPTSVVDKVEKCLDGDMCLDKLAASSSDKRGSWMLRNNYQNEQYRCIVLGYTENSALEARWSNGQRTTLCNDWRSCLQSKGSLDLVKAALKAARGEALLAEVQQQMETQERHQDALGCVDPLSADPEGWACDCGEVIKANDVCGSSPSATCLHQKLCSWTKTCQSWKSAKCGGALVDDEPAQPTKENASGASMDESLSDKRSC